MLLQYQNWQAFTFKGRKWLALEQANGDVHVFGEGMAWYGAYRSADSFRQFYARDGYDLCLEPARV